MIGDFKNFSVTYVRPILLSFKENKRAKEQVT